MKITMLGNKGAGKTTFMLAMYAIMSEGVNGFSLCTEDLDDDIDIIDEWENLLHGEGEERWPKANNEADFINHSFNFNYAVTNNLIKFDWVDYRGGALDEKEKESDSKDVAKIHQRLKESDCIFICVSGEYLKETSNKTKLARESGARRIKKLISNAFQEKTHIPIVIVVTKYDLCKKISQQELVNLIKQNFNDFFIEEGQWRIMICPVTLGQTLDKDVNCGAIEPINVHLPLIFPISYRYFESYEKVKEIKNKYLEQKKNLQNQLNQKQSNLKNVKKEIEKLNNRNPITKVWDSLRNIDPTTQQSGEYDDIDILTKQLEAEIEKISCYLKDIEKEDKNILNKLNILRKQLVHNNVQIFDSGVEAEIK